MAAFPRGRPHLALLSALPVLMPLRLRFRHVRIHSSIHSFAASACPSPSLVLLLLLALPLPLPPCPQVWDVAMEARPLKVIPVHEFLRPRLVELYESDCIFDKFEVSTAGRDGSSVMTGSYSNSFKIYDTLLGSETTVELAKGRPKPPAVRPVLGGVGLPPPPGEEYAAGGAAGGLAHGHGHRPPFDPLPPINPEAVDFSRKVLHFSWHPCEDIMAVAGLNNLYIYHAGGAGAGGMGGGGAAGGAGVGVGVGSAGHEP